MPSMPFSTRHFHGFRMDRFGWIEEFDEFILADALVVPSVDLREPLLTNARGSSISGGTSINAELETRSNDEGNARPVVHLHAHSDHR